MIIRSGHPFVCASFVGLTLYLFSCLEDTTRFGPPNGLRIRGTDVGAVDPCALPDGAATTSQCPDWTTDVFPLFDTTYGCADTNSDCHGASPGAAGLTLVPGDPAATYTALSKYKNFGRPYIQQDGQSVAYLMCNLRGTDFTAKPELGAIMPKGPAITATDILTIGRWVACGMYEVGGKAPGGGGAGATSTGAGGTGGTSSTGTAGGAGGSGGVNAP